MKRQTIFPLWLWLCLTSLPSITPVSLTIGDDQFPDPQVGRLCAYGDVNKDRYTDLIVQRGPKLVFMLQSEDGKFKSSARHGPIDLLTSREVFCATGDFDGDAALDVMVVSVRFYFCFNFRKPIICSKFVQNLFFIERRQ